MLNLTCTRLLVGDSGSSGVQGCRRDGLGMHHHLQHNQYPARHELTSVLKLNPCLDEPYQDGELYTWPDNLQEKL